MGNHFKELELKLKNYRLYKTIIELRETERDMIAGLATPAPQTDAFKPSDTNKFHSKTEDVVLGKDDEIAAIEAELYPLRLVVAQVEALFKLLTDSERLVFDLYYYDNLGRRETCDKFSIKYGYRDIRTIDSMRKKILHKFYTIVY